MTNSPSQFEAVTTQCSPSDSNVVWEREYAELKVIPSTTRQLPAKALTLFNEIIQFSRCTRVLDLGCGNGRNSVYLAAKGCTVDAIDYSGNALAELERRAKKADVASNIRMHHRPLGREFPFEADSFDLVLDIYVSCHFLDDDLKRHYGQEIRRVLKANGTLISVVFSTEDEYYRRLATDLHNGTIVVDPANQIPKQLYDEPGIKNFWMTWFSLLYFAKLEFADSVCGECYGRSVFALALTK